MEACGRQWAIPTGVPPAQVMVKLSDMAADVGGASCAGATAAYLHKAVELVKKPFGLLKVRHRSCWLRMRACTYYAVWVQF